MRTAAGMGGVATLRLGLAMLIHLTAPCQGCGGVILATGTTTWTGSVRG